MSTPELEEYIREHLAYAPDSPTGLRWIKAAPRKPAPGAPALTARHSQGYYHGRVGRSNLKAHRVVFFLAHGYWPAQVDHIDGNRQNNRMDNLRAASANENQHNQACKGYYFVSGKYRATIRVDGKAVYLGRFDTPEEARNAYLAAKTVRHPTAPERCYA